MKNIPLSKPTFDEETKKELIKVLESGWVGEGPKVKEFEIEFAKYVDAKYAVATNSATSALDMCLKVYDIQGGELITTPITFVADASVGEFNGMDVTFADIKEDDLCINPDKIFITNETRAIIAVDSHGRLADCKKIKEKFPNTLLIEDAAHAMYTPGVGKYSDLTVYSFQAVKTLPIFDGGMITTNNENIAKKLKSIKWLGVEKSTFDRVGQKGYTWEYDICHTGIKGYMTDVQAVIGLGQLKRLESMNINRRRQAKKYNDAFSNNDWFKEPNYSHTVQYYTPQWKHRDGLCEFLTNSGISVSVHFKPLSELTYWKKGKKNPLPVSETVWKNLLSLPIHESLTDEEQDYIISKVFEYYGK